MAKRINNTGLSRRQVPNRLTALGGAAVLAAFLEGCSTPDINQSIIFDPTPLPETPTSAPQFTPTTAASPGPLKPAETYLSPTATPTTNSTEALARVAFVKTTDRAEGVRKAIDLLGDQPCGREKRVFLKPNFNSADPTPGSTHPDVLTSLIAALNGMGAKAILVGDRSGMGNTRQVMEQIGVFRLAEELGFEALVLDELPAEDWVMIQPEGYDWDAVPIRTASLRSGGTGADLLPEDAPLRRPFHPFPEEFVGMVAKRHPQGSHEFMQELHNSAYQRRMIVEINAAYTPALIVLDGIEAFISGGPDVGEKVPSGVILAGTDRIAIDAVGVALLRYFGCKTEAARGKIFEQEQIARAVELELGIGSPQQVEFLTGDPESDAYSQKIKEILLAG